MQLLVAILAKTKHRLGAQNLRKWQASEYEGYEHPTRVMGPIVLEEIASQGLWFFCDVKTRICETPVLRKEFRMIGTTLSKPLMATQQ